MLTSQRRCVYRWECSIWSPKTANTNVQSIRVTVTSVTWNVNKIADEWTKQLLPVAGFKDTGKAIGNRKKRMNATEFVHLYRDGMKVAPKFLPSAHAHVPILCSACHQPCTSECICGELFCSRTCLRNAWPDHSLMCKIVVDENSIDPCRDGLHPHPGGTVRRQRRTASPNPCQPCQPGQPGDHYTAHEDGLFPRGIWAGS